MAAASKMERTHAPGADDPVRRHGEPRGGPARVAHDVAVDSVRRAVERAGDRAEGRRGGAGDVRERAAKGGRRRGGRRPHLHLAEAQLHAYGVHVLDRDVAAGELAGDVDAGVWRVNRARLPTERVAGASSRGPE